MKKLFQIGALFFGILLTQSAFAQSTPNKPANQNQQANQQQLAAQPVNQQYSSSPSQNAQINYGQSNSQYQFSNRQGYGSDNAQDYRYAGSVGIGYQGGNWSNGAGQFQYAEGQVPQGYTGSYQTGYVANSCCPEDHACPDQPCNDCYCLMVHYEPCYYTTQRCVEERVPCTKRCCRYVPKYYEVDRCRYVPEYYKETCCCQEPEYYEVPDCKICKKWVCDQHCKYVPKYYWKHTCGNECAPQQACCP